MTLPRWSIRVEESTDHHWVGTSGEVAMIFAYEGSHDDVRHVHAGARVIERLGRELGATVKLLFVVPPLHSKPPDAHVRGAVVQAARRVAAHLTRVAIVVGGTGFGPAVHRGAVTGVLALLRPSFSVRVERDVRDGLAFLIGAEHEAFHALVQHCEEHALGPERPHR